MLSIQTGLKSSLESENQLQKLFFLIVLVLFCVDQLLFLTLYEVFYEAAVLSTQRNYCPPKSALLSKVMWFI